jgi:hypothetical protein
MKTRIYTPTADKPSRELCSIYGDCLEKAGLRIPNRGQAIIDCSISPKVGDLVHCDNHLGTIHGFIKQVKEIKDEVIIVGTAYADESRDYTFEASVIYGVVTEVFDKVFGKQVYCRQTKGGDNDA